MPIQPKDTETILKEFEKDIQPTLKSSNLYINPAWLRSALASHLLWAVTEATKNVAEPMGKLNYEQTDGVGVLQNELLSLAQKLVE